MSVDRGRTIPSPQLVGAREHIGLWISALADIRLGSDAIWVRRELFCRVIAFWAALRYLLPLVVLVPAAVIFRRWILPATAAAVLAVGPLMGLNLHWPAWGDSLHEALSIRILTYNLQRYEATEGQLEELVAQSQPRFIALQEIPVHRWRLAPGWFVEHQGELIVASRYPIKRTEVFRSRESRDGRSVVDAIYCVVDALTGRIGFVHLDRPGFRLRPPAGNGRSCLHWLYQW